MVLIMVACGAGKKPDAVTIKIICESKEIRRIYYSCYFNDEYYGFGAAADLDNRELSEDTELEIALTKYYFDGREDISDLSMDFSPYGKDDVTELGTTEKVRINAEYGNSYTIVFSGDKESGFTARLREE